MFVCIIFLVYMSIIIHPFFMENGVSTEHVSRSTLRSALSAFQRKVSATKKVSGGSYQGEAMQITTSVDSTDRLPLSLTLVMNIQG